jgi:rhodanese-related sulfurtransferase
MARPPAPQASPNRWPLLRQAGLLLLIALALAAGSWSLRTPRLPLQASALVYRQKLAAPVITVAEALQFYHDDSRLFVDIRADDGSKQDYIPGSLPVRADSFADDLYALADFLYPEDELVLYGSKDLTTVSEVAARFQDRGYAHVSILDGGIEAWRRAGGPLKTGQEARHD